MRIPAHWHVVLHRQVKPVLNLSLTVLLAVSFLTGWLASLLGLTEFGLHKWSSIGLFVVAAVHLGLHMRYLAAQVRRMRAPQMILTAVPPRGLHEARVARPAVGGFLDLDQEDRPELASAAAPRSAPVADPRGLVAVVVRPPIH